MDLNGLIFKIFLVENNYYCQHDKKLSTGMLWVEYDAQAEAVVMACGPILWQAFSEKSVGWIKITLHFMKHYPLPVELATLTITFMSCKRMCSVYCNPNPQNMSVFNENALLLPNFDSKTELRLNIVYSYLFIYFF